jgi:multidrug efflux pump subunit AcrA (membrane-fusion protein)
MTLIKNVILISVLCWFTSVFAGPRHDHGEAPQVQSQTSVTPKLEAHSELFELLATVEKNTLRIYLDRYADNEPVRDAEIEVEATSTQSPAVVIRGKALAQEDGSYSWSAPGFALPGNWAFTFTVLQGADSDLLTGSLDASGLTTEPDSDQLWGLGPWGAAGVAGAAVLLAGAAYAIFASYFKRRRVAHAVLAACLTVTLAGLVPDSALAHGDEHASAPAVQGNAPRRQSDGTVFLPKSSQRQLDVRTVLAQTTEVAKTIELNGRVVMDPNAGGRIQSAQGGRIEAGPRGIPSIGQVVRKGEVLALVRPTTALIEQSNQAAALAENAINLNLAEQRLIRLEQLQGSVPQRDIETARAEVQALRERGKLTRAGLSAVEALLAPVSGVIAAMNVLAGQVVAPSEVLFEIVDPLRLRVEALVYDPAIAAGLSRAVASMPGSQTQNIPLVLIGAGRVLREQALPLQFRVEPLKAGGMPLLALGQPLVVRAELKATLPAIRLAASGLVKSPSNQDVVWVHTRAEVFEPRVVRWQALDASTVAITQGLVDGDRVVVRGTSLINQVR